MVALHKVDTMLARAGLYNKYWGRGAVRELCAILWDDEKITAAVMGRYDAGWALLVATEHRLLLIDKKPWYVTIEDIRYDMLAEVDFSAGVLDAMIKLNTFNKALVFRSVRQGRLRALTFFVQQEIRKARQHSANALQRLQQNAYEAAAAAEVQALAMPQAVMATSRWFL